MTTRELRKMLVEVENHTMTIKELRDLLFGIENQDAELSATSPAPCLSVCHYASFHCKNGLNI